MRSTRRTVLTPFVRAFYAVGVVACLCFSAGEGLRLTPLPAPQPEESSSPGLHVRAALSRGDARHLSGPLDLPAKGQVQKRTKRETPDCECPPSGGVGELPLYPARHSTAGRLAAHASRPSDERPPGRAPPPAS